MGADAFLIQYDSNGAPCPPPCHPHPGARPWSSPLNPASSRQQPRPPTPPHPTPPQGAVRGRGSVGRQPPENFYRLLSSDPPFALRPNHETSGEHHTPRAVVAVPPAPNQHSTLRESGGVGSPLVPVSLPHAVSQRGRSGAPRGVLGELCLRAPPPPAVGQPLGAHVGRGGPWSAWSSHLYSVRLCPPTPTWGTAAGLPRCASWTSCVTAFTLHWGSAGRPPFPCCWSIWTVSHRDVGGPPPPLTPCLPVCVQVGFWGPEFFKLEETASPKFQGHGAGKVSLLGVTQERLGCGSRLSRTQGAAYLEGAGQGPRPGSLNATPTCRDGPG